MPIWLQFIIQALFSFFATAAFALCINVPRRALIPCGWSGLLGWMVYWVLWQLGSGRMLANTAGAVILAFSGVLFARRYKMPAIIFNIPGLFPLVPGATAYQAVRELVLGDIDASMRLVVRVTLVAGSIAVGFMIAQLFGEFYSRYLRSSWQFRQRP
ncbi:threonine/serine exporter family protein [Schleiferilactobacillus perolens]|uniref:Threonine/Serine exporter ThrE domain-containing protein n=1 Tax=Schleiferilactobacillus perolens DSM 12744 TaxID=1423792 RepID=A0A0R1N8V2_9LACO|nr:threonine/serine exporter family protein [Schleiferilactobacillus perolens]KRL12776.1 hypothetical protein FD09_GL002763 [Schleiferilactobacillus perolens DSM 12744]